MNRLTIHQSQTYSLCKKMKRLLLKEIRKKSMSLRELKLWTVSVKQAIKNASLQTF